MKKDLFTEIIDNTTDRKAPVIYMIEFGEGDDYRFYIGKASRGTSRPLKQYPKCVYNYENGIMRKDYRKGGARRAWRPNVHPQLSEAKNAGLNIRLTMINVPIEQLDDIEMALIASSVKFHGISKTLNIEGVK